MAGLIARKGCSCPPGRHDIGAGSAAALAVHRFLEGTALALSASLTVTVALAVHALAEGLAVRGCWALDPGGGSAAGWPRCA